MIPLSCYKVKCMVKGCQHLASHKIGEENIYSESVPDEFDLKNQMDAGHNLTSYLCTDHFNMIMNRETNYIMEDNRFEGRDLDPAPPIVKTINVCLRGNDYQVYFEGEPKTWDCGHTIKDAINALLRSTNYEGKLKYLLGGQPISKEILYTFKERN